MPHNGADRPVRGGDGKASAAFQALPAIVRQNGTGRRRSKCTQAVIIGKRGSKIEYLLLLATAYAIPIIPWLGGVCSA
ncbi:MAG: hypothetical protein PVG35_20955 [Desulfobacterales bacterium]